MARGNDNQAKELVSALERLEREKNIKKEEVFKTIEDSLVSALRKHIGKQAQIKAVVDRETGDMSAFQVLNIVEVSTNPDIEISLEDAKAKNPKAKLGEEVHIGLDVDEFSRIAAQIAKQVLIQKIRDIERENLYSEYKPREGEIITGVVRRFVDRDIIVDMGKVEAILPYSEQIRKERYSPNARVKAMIYKVISYNDMVVAEDPVVARLKPIISRIDRTQRGPHVVLTRANPLFMRKLFEAEVPEISERIVEILSIERDPGFRAKVLVKSNDNKVDPIGACVGMRGMRIKALTEELSGERIDLIGSNIDTPQLIANAMSPAKVSAVKILDKEAKKALVIVPDDQLPIAIGRDWQNIKLASKLVGWELEAKSEGALKEEGLKAQAKATEGLTDVPGIGDKTAEILIKAGLTDVEKIATLSVEHLSTLQGVGEKTAAKIIRSAKDYVEKKKKESPSEDNAEQENLDNKQEESPINEPDKENDKSES
jgi:transcription termination/antitermination protein NusA